jgi:hypothetical protein
MEKDRMLRLPGALIRHDEAAHRLHVQPEEIEALIEGGRLKAKRSGELFFIDLDEAWNLLVANGRIRYRGAVTCV